MAARPLVILAGWLGCKPQHLRRYVELYQNAGFQVIARIPPPALVLRCCFPFGDQNQSPMQGEALQILGEASRTGSSAIVIHAFSNGGCFMWEAIRNLILESKNNKSATPEASELIVQNTRARLKGVVFDSCPGVELEKIDQAMEFCTLQERIRAAVQVGVWDYAFLHSQRVKMLVQQRSSQYVQGLREDPLEIPQLYFYSQDDSLATFDKIDEIVLYRQMQGHSVWRQTWEFSTHCGHILKHPQDYATVMDAFLKVCRSTQRSRL